MWYPTGNEPARSRRREDLLRALRTFGLAATLTLAFNGCGARSGLDGPPLDETDGAGRAGSLGGGRGGTAGAVGKAGSAGRSNSTGGTPIGSGGSGVAGFGAAGNASGGAAAGASAGVGGSVQGGAAGISGAGGSVGGFGGFGGFGGAAGAGGSAGFPEMPPTCDPLLAPWLGGPPALAAAERPFDGVVGDFNADGSLDLATSESQSATASVWLGDGNGAFRAGGAYNVGARPRAIAKGDLDGDGDDDLVTGGDGIVSALLSFGNGSFEAARYSMIGGLETRSLAVADFNRDGLGDVAAAVSSDGSSGAAVVLLGSGYGTFVPVFELALDALPNELGVADLNGDSVADVVVLTATGSTALLGAGDGTFGALALPTGGGGELALGNVDGDSYVDVVIGVRCAENGINSAVAVWLGTGNGDVTVGSARAINGCIGALEIGDVNNDTTVDFVLAPHHTLHGNGAGGFEADALGLENPGESLLGLGDFDADGLLDAAVAKDDGIGARLGDGYGTFGSLYEYPVGISPTQALLADLDRNGTLDVALSDPFTEGGRVGVMLGGGDGYFGAAVTYPTGQQPVDLAAGNLNADDLPELVTANFYEYSISVLIASGLGAYGTRFNYSTRGAPVAVAVGNVTSDAARDIVTANSAGPSLSTFVNAGDGTFPSRVDSTLLGSPNDVILFDLNGDALLDVAVINADANTVELHLAQGDGSFTLVADTPAAPGAETLAAGDLDGNGIIDLVSANGSSLSVYLRDGWTSFRGRRDYVASGRQAAIGDLDADGRLDVTVGVGTGFTILLGAGDGTFECVQAYAGFVSDSLAVGNIGGDPSPDVLTTWGSNLSVFLNAGP